MLMAGSTTRLFFNIVGATLMMAFWGGAGVGGIIWLLVMACLLHTIVLAVQLIDLPTPVLSAGPNGLTISKKITRRDLIEWSEIKNFDVVSLQQSAQLPIFSYLVIRASSAHFTGVSRILPSSWFGIYVIPTRMFEGGEQAARQLVEAVRKIKKAERLAAGGGGSEPVPDSSIGWSTLLGSTFSIAKDAPSEPAQVATVHRDLPAQDDRLRVLASKSGKAPVAKPEDWGRPAEREMRLDGKPAGPAPSLSQPTQPSPSDFGRKGVMLNGKPLK